MAIITSDTPIGTALPAVSRKFDVSMFFQHGARTLHNDQNAAEEEGLPRPIAVGTQVAALIFRMMRSSFEEGWVKGGKASLTFRKPVWVDDTVQAQGVVIERMAEGQKIRIVCDVWVQRPDGEKAIVGTCSALVST